MIDEQSALQGQLGLSVERLSARQCRQKVPGLAPGIRGGSWAPGDHQVDNRLLLGALEVAGRRAGVTMVAERVARVVRDGGRATGVETAGGRVLRAGAVVLCAGAECGRVGGLPEGIVPPVRPVKGHALRLAGGDGPVLPCTVRGLVRGRPATWCPGPTARW